MHNGLRARMCGQNATGRCIAAEGGTVLLGHAERMQGRRGRGAFAWRWRERVGVKRGSVRGRFRSSRHAFSHTKTLAGKGRRRERRGLLSVGRIGRSTWRPTRLHRRRHVGRAGVDTDRPDHAAHLARRSRRRFGPPVARRGWGSLLLYCDGRRARATATGQGSAAHSPQVTQAAHRRCQAAAIGAGRWRGARGPCY